MKKLVNFITRDHPYVYLGGSVLAALGLYTATTQPSELSFLGNSPLLYLPALLCLAFLALAFVALTVKLCNWKTYPDPGLWTGAWGTVEERWDGSEKQADFLLILVLSMIRSHLA